MRCRFHFPAKTSMALLLSPSKTFTDNSVANELRQPSSGFIFQAVQNVSFVGVRREFIWTPP